MIIFFTEVLVIIQCMLTMAFAMPRLGSAGVVLVFCEARLLVEREVPTLLWMRPSARGLSCLSLRDRGLLGPLGHASFSQTALFKHCYSVSVFSHLQNS